MNAHSIRPMPSRKPTMTTRSPTLFLRTREDPGRRARPQDYAKYSA
ncbi:MULTISPECIES: hypothetical protein [Paraburkholderia]|uniref:Uncharacterized protein n=1 Tax=Paraburkholderia guartelaensis TaxID=2546446 RepID=A0ABU9SKP3_9BURK|nr:hypothetical protein [Paraburkholderia nodosa]